MGDNRLTDKNRLSIINPKICKYWDYKKNYPLKPKDISYGNKKKVWWKCHLCMTSYLQSVHKKHKQKTTNRCPDCYKKLNYAQKTLASQIPSLIKYWHPTKNQGLTPYNIGVKSNKNIWWKCPLCKIEWQKQPYSYRIYLDYNSACIDKKCINHMRYNINKKNSLLYKYPRLAKDWHPVKNGNITPDKVHYGSHDKYWWHCKNNHKWQATIKNRVGSKHRGPTTCPYCANKKVCIDNCLATKYPEIAKEWHPTKNGKLTPYDVVSGGNTRRWWRCREGHVWNATVNDRTWHHNCPKCRGYVLKNNVMCASMIEAYWYLCLKQKNIKFRHDLLYNKGKNKFGKHRYDFYIPATNTYLEVTSYNKQDFRWKEYKKKINEKKHFVTKKLRANFKFVQMTLNKKQKDYVRKHIKKYPSTEYNFIT